ncbi:MAG: hypothetical protein Q6367_008780 [Candidatus Freyarchaeota archaeon]
MKFIFLKLHASNLVSTSRRVLEAFCFGVKASARAKKKCGRCGETFKVTN